MIVSIIFPSGAKHQDIIEIERQAARFINAEAH
jgi:hypothetical protein